MWLAGGKVYHQGWSEGRHTSALLCIYTNDIWPTEIIVSTTVPVTWWSQWIMFWGVNTINALKYRSRHIKHVCVLDWLCVCVCGEWQRVAVWFRFDQSCHCGARKIGVVMWSMSSCPSLGTTGYPDVVRWAAMFTHHDTCTTRPVVSVAVVSWNAQEPNKVVFHRVVV